MISREITSNRLVDWPSRFDRELLADACAKKRKKVTFTNGQEFRIRYETRTSLAWEKYGVCFIAPVQKGRFVPCGWFHIKFLLTEGS